MISRNTIPRWRHAATQRRPGNRRHSPGFTLIELLIVVAIIGILAGIAVPNYMGAQMKARVAQVKMDLRNLSQAIENYHLDRGKYPQRDADPNSFFIVTVAKLLTTPIAYMSSPSVQDPFGPVEEAEPQETLEAPGRADDAMPLPRNSYIYVPYKLFSYWQGNPVLDRDAYLIASVAPDRIDSSLVYLPFPGLSNVPIHSIRDTIYAPSNGVTSTGDIGRFGGAIQVGGSVGG
ncbi:MAG: prepilin-type N-terminal cleavage/methylation domain-containing protein [bacterium]